MRILPDLHYTSIYGPSSRSFRTPVLYISPPLLCFYSSCGIFKICILLVMHFNLMQNIKNVK